MNSFVPYVALLLLAAALVGADVRENERKCASEWNIQESDIRKIISDGASNRNEKCFLGCVFSACGMIVDGKFSPENARKKVADRYKDNAEALKVANDSIETCSKEVTTTEVCETGDKLRACIEKTAKQLLVHDSASR